MDLREASLPGDAGRRGRLRIGLIGVGVIARYYLRAIEANPHGVLRAVCDLAPEKLRPFEHAGVVGTVDAGELLDSEDVDAVIINLPNDLHHEMCTAALRAGKHVCCEKPLTLRAAEAQELAALASRRGGTLFTAFHRRYNHNVLSLLQRVRARGGIRSLQVRYFEQIREHCGADAWYLDPRRCGGGVIADNGPNALDLVHLFLGDVEVERALVEYSPQGVDVRARIECASRSGAATATLLLDWEYPRGERKDVTVVSADGSVDTADMLEGFPEFKSSLYHEYVAVLDDFIHHIRVRPDRTAGDPDGVEVARLGERARAIADAVPTLQLQESA
ncbi:MAG TPA: Gfo/Idh/MocA family oxidoreductase [Kofleriaceae bacterium]|nr:Gfo/Idh/MocA family oxidoreductase [Kofleriaceae bacterium]